MHHLYSLGLTGNGRMVSGVHLIHGLEHLLGLLENEVKNELSGGHGV